MMSLECVARAEERARQNFRPHPRRANLFLPSYFVALGSSDSFFRSTDPYRPPPSSPVIPASIPLAFQQPSAVTCRLDVGPCRLWNCPRRQSGPQGESLASFYSSSRHSSPPRDFSRIRSHFLTFAGWSALRHLRNESIRDSLPHRCSPERLPPS